MSTSKAAKRWDARRKVAVDSLKKRVDKLSKQTDEVSKDKLKKAETTLAATLNNMGKGSSAVKNK